MGKTYEALYENGHLEWLGEPPGAGRHRPLVTVVSTSPPRHTLQEVHRLLEATRGAWGHGKTLEESVGLYFPGLRFPPGYRRPAR
jgi:hypothetical protein